MKTQDFHYLISGKENGPWIVFLHGLLGAAANWRRIIPAFEADYHVLAYDQRGHGRSFKPAQGYFPDDFAGDLKFLMDELGIPRAHIVGHSMGGRNALCFASTYPEKVNRLVIEDIAPAAVFAHGSPLVKKLKRVPVPFPDRKAAKEYFLNEFGDPKLGNFLYNSITLDDRGRGIWKFDLDMVVEILERGRAKDRWYELEGLKVPTLVVRGDESDELSPGDFERMKKSNIRVQGAEVKGAGHWVHFDKPREFTDLVKNFLETR